MILDLQCCYILFEFICSFLCSLVTCNSIWLQKNNRRLDYKKKAEFGLYPNLSEFILKLFSIFFQLGTDALKKKTQQTIPSFQHPLQANCFDATKHNSKTTVIYDNHNSTLIIPAPWEKTGKHVIVGHKELILLTKKKVSTQWLWGLSEVLQTRSSTRITTFTQPRQLNSCKSQLPYTF